MMVKSDSVVVVEADPADDEDFDISVAGVEQALTERRRRVGRPKGTSSSDREQIALRVPRPVLDHFRAGGPGWQTRMIEVLERESRRAG